MLVVGAGASGTSPIGGDLAGNGRLAAVTRGKLADLSAAESIYACCALAE